MLGGAVVFVRHSSTEDLHQNTQIFLHQYTRDLAHNGYERKSDILLDTTVINQLTKRFRFPSSILSLTMLKFILQCVFAAQVATAFSPGFFRRTQPGGLAVNSKTFSKQTRIKLLPREFVSPYANGGNFSGNVQFTDDAVMPALELDKIGTTKPTEEENPKTLGDPDPDLEESGLLWRGVVLVLCALWASNFAAAKLIMGEPGVDSSLYTVSRFSVAALALIPGSISAVRRGAIDWETARGAAVCGSWVSFGYLGQTLGLLTTTASRSCVICTLHCVFVAAVAEFVRVARSKVDSKFDFKRLVPAAIAVLGVAIVEIKGAGGAPNIGDALSFAQPIGFGMGYLQLEELVRKKPEAGLPISAIKLSMVSFFSYGLFELYPLLHHEEFALRIPDFQPIISSPLATSGILYTGLVTTALALWVESIAFKRVPATDASIILTTEPLFAALAGAFTLGETFGMSDYVGASLIIGACASAVLIDDGHGGETVE